MLSHFHDRPFGNDADQATAQTDGAEHDGRYGKQSQSQPYARRPQNGGVTRRGRA